MFRKADGKIAWVRIVIAVLLALGLFALGRMTQNPAEEVSPPTATPMPTEAPATPAPTEEVEEETPATPEPTAEPAEEPTEEVEEETPATPEPTAEAPSGDRNSCPSGGTCGELSATFTHFYRHEEGSDKVSAIVTQLRVYVFNSQENRDEVLNLRGKDLVIMFDGVSQNWTVGDDGAAEVEYTPGTKPTKYGVTVLLNDTTIYDEEADVPKKP